MVIQHQLRLLTDWLETAVVRDPWVLWTISLPPWLARVMVASASLKVAVEGCQGAGAGQ